MMILVTGATGFIGHHLFGLLSERAAPGSVRLFLPEGELEKIDNSGGFSIVTGDLSDKDALFKATQGVDTIIHLASKNIDRNGTGFRKVNIEGTANLSRAAAACGCKKFIYLSSVGVYGHHKYRNAGEETRLDPDTPFSGSKAEAEKIILQFHGSGKFTGIIVRHRFVYGEGDIHVLPRIIKAVLKYPFLISKGRAKVSLIFVKELAEILYRFAVESIPHTNHPVYHATDGVPISYSDIVKTICSVYSLKYPKIGIPFYLLYLPIRLYEKLFSIDPETAASSLSSIRLKLVGLDNYYSNQKLAGLFPGVTLTPFIEVFPGLADYYRQFIHKPAGADKHE